MWDFTSKELYTFREFYIPPRMMSGLKRYIEDHIAPGDFLSAVIKNDLVKAVGFADDENMHNLPAYAMFLYNETPSFCWGNKGLFKQWLSEKEENTE